MNTDNKKEILIPEELPQECKSASGRTIGLIDSLISIANVLVTDDFLYQEGIEDALADLQASDNMKRLMNIGELSDAKDYIKKQQRQIDLLSDAISELSRHLHTQFVQTIKWVKADDKKPPINRLVHCKTSRDRSVVTSWNGEWDNYPLDEDAEVVSYWLEETQSLPLPLTEGEKDMRPLTNFESEVLQGTLERTSKKEVWEKEEEKDRYLKFKCAGHQKGGDFFQIYMEDEDSGKRYVTEFNGAFGRILFDKELVRKAAQVRKVLEILLEGYSEYWPGYITDKVNDAIDNAKTWMEPEPPTPTPGEQEVPAEILEWISRNSAEVIPEVFVVSKCRHAFEQGHLAGAIAMYRKIWAKIERQNLAILGHIKNRQDLEAELSRQISLKKSCLETIEDQRQNREKLEAQLSSANARIKELEQQVKDLQDWHDSHM